MLGEGGMYHASLCTLPAPHSCFPSSTLDTKKLLLRILLLIRPLVLLLRVGVPPEEEGEGDEEEEEVSTQKRCVKSLCDH